MVNRAGGRIGLEPKTFVRGFLFRQADLTTHFPKTRMFRESPEPGIEFDPYHGRLAKQI
jgi:hypothetical protein